MKKGKRRYVTFLYDTILKYRLLLGYMNTQAHTEKIMSVILQGAFALCGPQFTQGFWKIIESFMLHDFDQAPSSYLVFSTI